MIFFGQSLTGLWIGTTSNDSSTMRKDQSFEIALTEYKGKVYGYSRSEFIVNDTLYYIVKRVKGTIEGNRCEVTDDEIISYNFRGKLDKGIRVTSTFIRNQHDSTWSLAGTWKTNATKKYYAVTGKVKLSEEKDLNASKIFPHLEELNLADKIAFYQERKEAPSVVRVVKPEKDLSTTETPVELDVSGNTALVVPPQEKKRAETDAVISEGILREEKKKKEEEQERLRQQEITAKKEIEKPVANPSSQTEKPAVAKSSPDPSKKPEITGQISEQLPENSTIAQKNKPGTAPLTDADRKRIQQQQAQNAVNRQKPSLLNKPQDQKTDPEESPKSPTKISNPVTVQQNNQEKETKVIKGTNDQTATVANDVRKKGIDPAIKPDITSKAAVVEGRKSEFSQEVSFKGDSLQISIYDNGVVDGDTVSVFLNGEVILARQGLKASAIKKTIYLTPGKDDEFTLVLFADNLGQYPPNTGLLVVRDGNDVYNLRFSADYQKNAGVIFRRKK